MSDRLGPRRVMYWVLSVCVACFLLLIVPRMDIQSPGEGVMAGRPGTVTFVSDSKVVVGDMSYALRTAQELDITDQNDRMLILPTSNVWQVPVVQVGDEVKGRQLLAKGVTHIYFQANVWIFTGIVFVTGIVMGIGMAAVYRHITDYFPSDVGVAGGMVGVIGGLGGFLGPVIFGYLLKGTGIWTTTWMFLALLAATSLAWMHFSIQRVRDERAG